MAGDKSLTQQAGTAPNNQIANHSLFTSIRPPEQVGIKLSMYLQGKRHICYRSFDSFDLLLRKFEREKNDLDAGSTR